MRAAWSTTHGPRGRRRCPKAGNIEILAIVDGVLVVPMPHPSRCPDAQSPPTRPATTGCPAGRWPLSASISTSCRSSSTSAKTQQQSHNWSRGDRNALADHGFRSTRGGERVDDTRRAQFVVGDRPHGAAVRARVRAHGRPQCATRSQLTPGAGFGGSDCRYRVDHRIRVIKGNKGFRVGHLDQLAVAE